MTHGMDPSWEDRIMGLEDITVEFEGRLGTWCCDSTGAHHKWWCSIAEADKREPMPQDPDQELRG